MYLTLRTCDICGYASFEPGHQAFTLGGRIDFHSDGHTAEVCQECLTFLVQGRTGTYELRDEIATPVRYPVALKG